ncbi:291_t:CDS:1, partial [Gigaspora margarita]
SNPFCSKKEKEAEDPSLSSRTLLNNIKDELIKKEDKDCNIRKLYEK